MVADCRVQPAPQWLVMLLVALYGGVLLWSGWSPGDRLAWALENILPTILALVLVICRRRFGLSTPAVLMLFAFLVLHQVGAHYIYSEVPLGWSLGGLSGSPRNDFDRLVHMCFGLLLFLPVREVMASWLRTGALRAGIVAVMFVLAASALYEIMEMVVVMLVYPGTGAAFLGLQGDPWDTQKDMLMAFLGSLAGFILSGSARRGESG